MSARVIRFPHHRARGAASGTPRACPTCAQFGVPGWLPVTVPPHTPDNPYDQPVTAWRPCRSCALDHWRDWRDRRRRPRSQEYQR